ncbi:MAG: 2-hydroxychromene-2-carboxylate isomerase [Pseudomonadota bacterium]
MAHIDYFFSVLSPWTYFAGSRLEELADTYEATIAYKPIDAFTVFKATGGVPVHERPPSRQEYRAQELRRTSARTGMPYHFQPAHWPTNAVAASQAVISVGQASGPVGALAQALLAAVWTEQKDIADHAVIEEKLANLNIDPAALNQDEEALQTVLEANTQEAIERGVFGVPFYIVGDERFWGQDKLDDLATHLSQI